MLGVRSTVEVDDDAVRTELERGHLHAVACGGGLPLLVQNLLVLLVTRRQRAVGDKLHPGAERQLAVREALLRFEVANQLLPALFIERLLREIDTGRMELGGDIGGRGLHSHREDLRAQFRNGRKYKPA